MSSEQAIGEAAAGRVSEDAAETMRAAIHEAGGREVFFAGPLTADGRVESVRVCARGTDGAVPAVFESLDPRDVVIHNHPGGDLEPSEADLELGIVYSSNGHGVYIVDNDVTRVYVVIEPFLPRDRTLLDSVELETAIGPHSAIAQRLPDYEVRPQQVAMMDAVAAAFNDDGIAVVEAPTGVGKTLAYLLPAALWSVRNRERVVISTRTINLQEQIVFKDVPLLQRCLPESFTAVLVKGRQNYVCPRRLDRALSEATLFDDEEEQAALKTIAEWAAHTADGSKSDLSFVPPRALWERVCSEADTCTAAQCNAAGNCFVAKARREIAKADLVVVNHHMLFSDLAIKKELGSFNALAVLPAFERLILDEAHHIEDSATEYFGVDVTRNGSLALLGRFVRLERGQERGLLPYIKLKLLNDDKALSERQMDAALRIIDESVLPGVAAAREALLATFEAIRAYTAEHCGQIGRDIKWRLTQEVLADPGMRALHSESAIPAAAALTALANHCTNLLGLLRDGLDPGTEPESSLSMEIAQLNGYRDRLVRASAALVEGTSAELEENTVRWIEIDARNNSIVRITRCPLEVGKPLSEWVYPNLKTVAMTSATLSVAQSLEFLFSRIGLDRVDPERVARHVLDTPFDFQNQVLVCIPEDIAAPDEAAFQEDSVRYMGEVLGITGGHAFLLFTSFYALNQAYSALHDKLKAAGVTALKQGDAARSDLLERFRRDVSSALFATDSFWEGVDVPGESLQCVILPRLPFRVPTEPILQARAEAIEKTGGNAFMDYAVPLAVIKFRQGFGRLIRRKTDRGTIVILDSRVVSRRYGRSFLQSIPDARVVRGSEAAILAALNDFHAPDRKAAL